MLIKTSDSNAPLTSDITPESIYHERRSLLKNLGYIGASSLLLPHWANAAVTRPYEPAAERSNAPT